MIVAVRRRGAPSVDAATPAGAIESSGGFDWLRRGLARTTAGLGLGALFSGSKVDDQLFEALEEALIAADVGVKTTTILINELRRAARQDGISEPGALRERLKALVLARLTQRPSALNPAPASGPHVILVVGVNGSGKTTTIGKLGAAFVRSGKKVVLGAGDTFRAGAVEQLRVWSERAGAELIAGGEGADPAAVLHDTLEAAKARGAQVVLCDTAGRLQSKKPLMEELGKVHRVIGRAVPGAPHEVLLVLDGTMGQNALSQARIFGEVTGVTGVVLTKLDGTAKGGVVIAVMEELGLPVKFVGVGEKVDDLRPFDAAAFVEVLLGEAP
ncbi:signal recognition particle-docking protein FtsY [Myxococcota bacterium]|nr:signal recognition particle-docking protein FtsY [Myxococcota bacterium]